MLRWAVLLAAVVSEVTASLSLKSAVDRPAFFVVVVAGYAAAFGCLVMVLRLGTPLGVAYGLWAALGVAATALLSTVVHGEPLTPVMGVGLAMIAAGVLVIELGHQRAHERVRA